MAQCPIRETEVLGLGEKRGLYQASKSSSETGLSPLFPIDLQAAFDATIAAGDAAVAAQTPANKAEGQRRKQEFGLDGRCLHPSAFSLPIWPWKAKSTCTTESAAKNGNIVSSPAMAVETASPAIPLPWCCKEQRPKDERRYAENGALSLQTSSFVLSSAASPWSRTRVEANRAIRLVQ